MKFVFCGGARRPNKSTGGIVRCRKRRDLVASRAWGRVVGNDETWEKAVLWYGKIF
jgi:hypothetical protein